MRSIEELIKEVVSRNNLRAELGLPLVPDEVQKLYEVELRQDFLDWCKRNSDPWAHIESEELDRERKERRNTNWLPRALLNGAWAFGSRVQDRMRNLWREERVAKDKRQRETGKN